MRGPDVDADDKTETDVADMDMTEQQADTIRKIDMSDVEIEMPEINTSSSHFLRAQKSVYLAVSQQATSVFLS